jgi:hypothetical protein
MKKMVWVSLAGLTFVLAAALPARAGIPLCARDAIPAGEDISVNNRVDPKYVVVSTELVFATSPDGAFYPVGSLYATHGAGWYFGYGTLPSVSVPIAGDSPANLKDGYRKVLVASDTSDAAKTFAPAYQILNGIWKLSAAPCRQRKP